MITLLHSLSKRWGERNAIFMTGESLNVWILLVAPEYGRVWRHSAVLAGSARASGQLARKLSPLLLPMSAVVLRVASVAVDFESSRRSYCPPILMEIMLWLLGGNRSSDLPNYTCCCKFKHNHQSQCSWNTAPVAFVYLPSLHVQPLSAGYMSLLFQAGERSQYCATARWSTYLAPVIRESEPFTPPSSCPHCAPGGTAMLLSSHFRQETEHREKCHLSKVLVRGPWQSKELKTFPQVRLGSNYQTFYFPSFNPQIPWLVFFTMLWSLLSILNFVQTRLSPLPFFCLTVNSALSRPEHGNIRHSPIWTKAMFRALYACTAPICGWDIVGSMGAVTKEPKAASSHPMFSLFSSGTLWGQHHWDGQEPFCRKQSDAEKASLSHLALHQVPCRLPCLYCRHSPWLSSTALH